MNNVQKILVAIASVLIVVGTIFGLFKFNKYVINKRQEKQIKIKYEKLREENEIKQKIREQEKQEKIEKYRKYSKDKWNTAIKEALNIEYINDVQWGGEYSEVLYKAVDDFYSVLLMDLNDEESKNEFRKNQENWKDNISKIEDKKIEKKKKEYGGDIIGTIDLSTIYTETAEQEGLKRMEELVNIWEKLYK